MRNPTFDQLLDAEAALTVPCHFCGAKPGRPCTTTDIDGSEHELVNIPAHWKRIQRAQRHTDQTQEAPMDGLFDTHGNAEPSAYPELRTDAEKAAQAHRERFESIPVVELGLEHVGRTVRVAGRDAAFTGTHRGQANGIPFVIVHAKDHRGFVREQPHTLTDRIDIERIR